MTTGMYNDGTLGEVFFNGIGKDGSTLRGFADAWAVAMSIGLQYGVPLETYVRMYLNVSFPPSGRTIDPSVPSAASIPDYVARSLASQFLSKDVCDELGVLTSEVKQRLTERLDSDVLPVVTSGVMDLGCACRCGAMMQRAGTCWQCPSCFASTGCG